MNLKGLRLTKGLLVVVEVSIAIDVEVLDSERAVSEAQMSHLIVSTQKILTAGIYLLKEILDFDLVDSVISISVDSLESSEGLEVWYCGQKLSLSLDYEFIVSNDSEVFLQFVLTFNTKHLIEIK
jgi:hypothetical protein